MNVFVEFKTGDRIKPNMSTIPEIDMSKVYVVMNTDLENDLIYVINDSGVTEPYDAEAFDWTTDYYKPENEKGDYYYVKDYEKERSYHYHGTACEVTYKLTLQAMDGKIHTGSYTQNAYLDHRRERVIGKIARVYGSEFDLIDKTVYLGYPSFKSLNDPLPQEEEYDGWIY